MPKMTNAIIEAAIHGFEAQKMEIDLQIAVLRGMLNGTATAADEAATAKKGRRKFSAAARKRMRKAQKARWAKIKGESAAAKTAKPRRTMSAAARKAIADAQRKRWATKRAVA